MVSLPGRYEKKRLLILGSTSISYSTKHGLTNCTGGIVEDTGALLRIFPVPRVLLAEDQQFRAWQWIEVDLMKATDDPRPESFKIDVDSIRPGERIGTTLDDHRLRRTLLAGSPNNCVSLEQAKERQHDEGLSLAIVRPERIRRCFVRSRPAKDREEWERTQRAVLGQTEMPFDQALWRVPFTDVEFMVSFECADARCKGHEYQMHDWQIAALYHRLRRAHDSRTREKVEEKMSEMLDLDHYEVALFFGTFRDHMTTFGLMGSYSCPRKAIERPVQTALF